MSRRTGARVALAAALLGLVPAWAGPLAAQEAPAASALTLPEALAMAERSNPGYRQATNDLELNDIESRQMWLSLLPRPSFNVLNTRMSWNLTRVGTDNFGNPIPNPEPRMVQSSRSQQGAGLNFSFDFGSLLQMRQNQVQWDNREVVAVNQLTNLHANVRRAFLEAQERQLTVDLEAELLATELQNQEAADLLFRLARSERLDVLEAGLAVTEQEEALRQARANLSNALLALRNAIGDPALTIERVDPAPLREVDAETLDEEALVAAALELGPRVRQQEGQIELAEREVSLGRAEWLPTLTVGLSTGRTELNQGSGSAFFQPTPSSDWDRNISVALDFGDVGQYFTRENQARRTRLDVRNAREQLRQVQLDVEQDVRSALVQLRSAQGSLELREEQVGLAEERRELQLERYRLGQGTFVDLQNASSQAAAARRALLQSGYQFERALLDLEQTLGMPLPRILDLGTR